MRISHRWVWVLVLAAVSGHAADSAARDHIEVAGSSTVFPFTARVIQAVSNAGVTVVNKSTGSSGGIHAFCGGTGDAWPDITAASRPMTDAERRRCADNGVDGITELPIGFDGIVLANAVGAPRASFTRVQLYKALAREIPVGGVLTPNPHFSWNEVDPSLPPVKIEVLGPPATSGTRDMFQELAIRHGCETATLPDGLPPERLREACTALRQDGHYVEMGEDDLEIVKRLKLFENAFGLFGYSYVLRYHDIVKANPIDGVLPTDETIESRKYPLSRPLYLYVKDRQIPSVPGLAAFLTEYMSDRAIGDDGYLLDIGLVPLSRSERTSAQALLKQRVP